MSHLSGQIDEDFLQFEKKVHQLQRFLEEQASSTAAEHEQKDKGEVKYDDTVPDDFIIKVRECRTVINKGPPTGREEQETMDKSRASPSSSSSSLNKIEDLRFPNFTADKFTFMQQMEQDAQRRYELRKERERLAQKFRTLGNEAYRKFNFEKAIKCYTDAIEHIRDSPILYNNRALSFIKLNNSRRAIIDCDYVLNKLDEKNLRSWLYRAISFRRLNDIPNYEASIAAAKKHNSKMHNYIDEFLERSRGEGL